MLNQYRTGYVATVEHGADLTASISAEGDWEVYYRPSDAAVDIAKDTDPDFSIPSDPILLVKGSPKTDTIITYPLNTTATSPGFLTPKYQRLRTITFEGERLDARGRMTALPPALRARQWGPGQSGNPSGRGGLYHEVQRLAREASPGAVQRLIELAQLDRRDEEGKLLPLTSDADHRIVLLASSTLIERGFGKPRDDNDPKAEEPPKPKFNPALYTPAQLAQIEATLRMIAATQAGAEDGL